MKTNNERQNIDIESRHIHHTHIYIYLYREIQNTTNRTIEREQLRNLKLLEWYEQIEMNV